MIAAGEPQGAGFDVLLLGHVACVAAALVTSGLSGLEARRLWVALGRREVPVSVRRYFEPGVGAASRLLYGVPVLGFALLAASGGAYRLADAWVASGLGLSVGALAVAEGVLWPAERRLEQLLKGPSGLEGAPKATITACRQAVAGSVAVTAMIVGGVVVMVVRP